LVLIASLHSFILHDSSTSDLFEEAVKTGNEFKLSDLLHGIDLTNKKFIMSYDGEGIGYWINNGESCYSQKTLKHLEMNVSASRSWSIFPEKYKGVIIIYDNDNFFQKYTLYNTASLCDKQEFTCMRADKVIFSRIAEYMPYYQREMHCYKIIEK
jgi:hypothetical protein